jgi:transposase InsO family protein
LVNRQFQAERTNILWVSDFTDVSTWQGLVTVVVVFAWRSVGDSYDHALAETINGLYKAEVIHRQSWKNREAVELATLAWIDWFNHRRLLGSIGNATRRGRRG